MPGRFLQIVSLQVVALVLTTPVAAQSEVPAGLFRKGKFERQVEQQLDEHEQRLTRLEVVSSPRRSGSGGSGKEPIRPVPVRSTAAAAVSGSGGAHTVRAGETPSAIARRYRLSVANLLKANGLSEGSVIHPGQKLLLPGASKGKPAGSTPSAAAPVSASKRTEPSPKSGGGFGRYTVKSGETVRGLASRFGVTQKELMRLNGLKDATKLRAGAVVKYPLGEAAVEAAEASEAVAAGPVEERLPSGWRWHEVERGESLSQIAARYGQDRGSLERANALGPGTPIHEGRKLKIPPPGVSIEPDPPAVAKRPPGTDDHSVLAYQVQKGDTLDQLAETFATTPAILRSLNRLEPTDLLATGRRIVVPNNLFE